MSNKISRRTFAKQVGLGLSGLVLNSTQVLGSVKKYKDKSPNIIFICSDQHSYKYLGYAGHPLVKTPNLDLLAKEGTVFLNAYSGQPVCVPGRACLMTGMYASDTGSYCNSTVWDGSYPIWGSYLKNGGYFTRAYGKLELDGEKDTGFDEINTTHEHKVKPDITSLFRNPLCYRMKERSAVNGKTRMDYHADDLEVTNEAVNFISKESKGLGKPWTLYLGYLQPHPPFEAKEEYYNLYKDADIDMPEVNDEELENMHIVYQHLRHFKRIATPINKEKIRKARIAYYGMITELDKHIGKVIRSLKDSGQYENTYIVYTSDHGDSLGEHGLWYKNNLLESAVHVPLLICGPGIKKGKRISTPVSHVDVTPTLLELAGQDKPGYLRGNSLLPLMKGKTNCDQKAVYAESHSEGNCTGSFMIRKGDWKYIYFTGYEDLLYNLKEDPNEKVNRINDKDCVGILADLKKELIIRVNPDKITYDAFRKQKEIRDNLVKTLTKDELINMLEGRLGKGQAEVLVTQLTKQLY